MNERQVDYSKAAVLNRGIDVLIVIKNTKIATSGEIQAQALPHLSIRSVQRYLSGLVVMGLVSVIRGGKNDDFRYFLSGKAKQLFGVTE